MSEFRHMTIYFIFLTRLFKSLQDSLWSIESMVKLFSVIQKKPTMDYHRILFMTMSQPPTTD